MSVAHEATIHLKQKYDLPTRLQVLLVLDLLIYLCTSRHCEDKAPAPEWLKNKLSGRGSANVRLWDTSGATYELVGSFTHKGGLNIVPDLKWLDGY